MSDKVPSMEALPFRARCGSDFRVYQHCHLCSAARSQGTICLCVPSALNVIYTSGVSCFTRETSAVSESHWIQKQIFQYHISTRGQYILIPPETLVHIFSSIFSLQQVSCSQMWNCWWHSSSVWTVNTQRVMWYEQWWKFTRMQKCLNKVRSVFRRESTANSRNVVQNA